MFVDGQLHCPAEKQQSLVMVFGVIHVHGDGADQH